MSNKKISWKDILSEINRSKYYALYIMILCIFVAIISFKSGITHNKGWLIMTAYFLWRTHVYSQEFFHYQKHSSVIKSFLKYVKKIQRADRNNRIKIIIDHASYRIENGMGTLESLERCKNDLMDEFGNG